MVEKGVDQKHPSFGLVKLSRVQQGPPGAALFDSPFRHQHYITLTISRARKTRHDLHCDLIMSERQLIEVALSEAQFAHMVTSPNMGEGTPCTLQWCEGEAQPRCPDDATKETFAAETSEEFKAVIARMRELEMLVNTLTKKERINAVDKETLRSAVFEARRVIDDNLPFLQGQFAEAMDKIVNQAKTEVEAHVHAMIRKAGLENVKREDFPVLEGPKEG